MRHAAVSLDFIFTHQNDLAVFGIDAISPWNAAVNGDIDVALFRAIGAPDWYEEFGFNNANHIAVFLDAGVSRNVQWADVVQLVGAVFVDMDAFSDKVV